MSLVQIIVSLGKARVFLHKAFLKKKPRTWGTNFDHFSTKWLKDQLSSALPCKETKAVEHTRTHHIWWQVQAYQHIKPTLGMNRQAPLWSCPFHKKNLSRSCCEQHASQWNGFYLVASARASSSFMKTEASQPCFQRANQISESVPISETLSWINTR